MKKKIFIISALALVLADVLMVAYFAVTMAYFSKIDSLEGFQRISNGKKAITEALADDMSKGYDIVGNSIFTSVEEGGETVLHKFKDGNIDPEALVTAKFYDCVEKDGKTFAYISVIYLGRMARYRVDMKNYWLQSW